MIKLALFSKFFRSRALHADFAVFEEMKGYSNSIIPAHASLRLLCTQWALEGFIQEWMNYWYT